jgi:hypothetical protein
MPDQQDWSLVSNGNGELCKRNSISLKGILTKRKLIVDDFFFFLSDE